MGGTEAFPDLGNHCQRSDCRQLDFLPFTCKACSKITDRANRRDCPKSDIVSRKVVVCEVCSSAIETTGAFGEDEKKILERHEKSRDCDPKKKMKKPTCPVKRCREVLTFSNTATCKSCQIKTCLKHRFQAEHTCQQLRPPSSTPDNNNKFLAALALRRGKDCGNKIGAPGSGPRIKAC